MSRINFHWLAKVNLDQSCLKILVDLVLLSLLAVRDVGPLNNDASLFYPSAVKA